MAPHQGHFWAIILSILVILLLSSDVETARTPRNRDNAKKDNSNRKLCTTEDCNRAASVLKESIDSSVDPCDNFYGYACGKWIKNHKTQPMPEYSHFVRKQREVHEKLKNFLESRANDNELPWAIKQAKIFYKSCTDRDVKSGLGLTPLRTLLKKLTLPETPAAVKFVQNNFKLPSYRPDVVTQLARSKRFFNNGVLFDVVVQQDPRNNSERILVISPPNVRTQLFSNFVYSNLLDKVHKLDDLNEDGSEPEELEDSEVFVSRDNFAVKVQTAFIKYFYGMVKMLNNDKTDVNINDFRSPLTSDEEKYSKIALKLLELIQIFDHIQTFRNSLFDELAELDDVNYMTLNRLQLLTDNNAKAMNFKKTKMVWKKYMNKVFQGIKKFDSDQEVLVLNIDYMKKISIFMTEHQYNIELFVWWNVLQFAMPITSKTFRDFHENYLKYMGVQRDGVNLDDSSCLRKVEKLYGLALSRVLINETFIRNQDHSKVKDMIENIKLAFSNRITELYWMNDEVKYSTQEKIRALESLVGYPEWLLDEKKVNSLYEGVFMSKTHFFENVQKIFAKIVFDNLNKLNSNESLFNDWISSPNDVNAFYFHPLNKMIVPATILEFPFFGLGLEALNYGAIGSILGHEIIHGFDNNGRIFDTNSNVKEWWDFKTILHYNQRAQCFVKHYNNYHLKFDLPRRIDGRVTLSENIADNGGLVQAFNAYQLWRSKHKTEAQLPGFTSFSHNQLFFIAYSHTWCQVHTFEGLYSRLDSDHAPSKVRVNSVLQNFDKFRETWQCPDDTKMNPRGKCELW